MKSDSEDGKTSYGIMTEKQTWLRNCK